MPTIRPEPRRSSPPGYTTDLSLASVQIEDLADLLRIMPEDIAQPIGEAVRRIGVWAYTSGAIPTPAESRAALQEVAKTAEALQAALRSLCVADRNAVLIEYAGLRREADALSADYGRVVADGGPLRLADAALADARENFQADLSGLVRLSDNFAVAAKRKRPRNSDNGDVAPIAGTVRRGRPRNLLDRVIGCELQRAYEKLRPILPAATTQQTDAIRRNRFLDAATRMIAEHLAALE